MDKIKELYNDLHERGYSIDVINQFCSAYKEGIILPRDVDDADMIRKIRHICKGKKFNSEQINIILNGYKMNVNVELYAKSIYHAYIMQEIFYGLKKGVDVSPYAEKYVKSYKASYLGLYLHLLVKALSNKFTEEQIKCLENLFEQKVYIDKIEKVYYSLLKDEQADNYIEK